MLVAAEQIARNGMADEGLLCQYLLRTTEYTEASAEIRSAALVMIARLFLEDPVDTPEEFEDCKKFRDRLKIMLSENSLTETDRCYAIAALSCCARCRLQVLVCRRA